MRRRFILRIALIAGLLLLGRITFGAVPAHAECPAGEADQLVFQASGKLLVGLCGQDRAAVLRLDQAGRLDETFAGDGSLGPWPSPFAPHLATSGGKLLVEMRLGVETRRERVVLRRFTADGALDRSFAAGNALVPTNPNHSSPESIRVYDQPGGTSVVAYYATDDGCYEGECTESANFIRLLRYSRMGKPIGEAQYYNEYWDLDGLTMAPDGGLIVTGIESEYRIGTYLRTKPDLKPRARKSFAEGLEPGGPVAAGPGTSFFAVDPDGLLVRHRLGGSVDETFGDGGSVDCKPRSSYFSALLGLGAGGLLAAGGGGKCELVKYRPDGSLDRTFGADGRVDLRALGRISRRYRLESVALGPTGRIAVALAADEGPILKILRFSSDGRLETRFGTGGVVTVRDFRPA